MRVHSLNIDPQLKVYMDNMKMMISGKEIKQSESRKVPMYYLWMGVGVASVLSCVWPLLPQEMICT